MKAALLPQSCCQVCTIFRRQQLTLFSSHTFYRERQWRQRKSPFCSISSCFCKGTICCLLTPPVFKIGIYFTALAVLTSSRHRKVTRAGHPVPNPAPDSLCVTFGDGGRGRPDLICLSSSAGVALALPPPLLGSSRSCQLPSVFLKPA